ncbi:hypothetical protein KC19_6G052100 [Ceratodon purpureus]|uniref:Acetylornithine transaminase n=1 Tax=Ceratodon purpureus TaxID=3225 RepID=A0A8T0HDD2_CERPU|nr:hypothetical protein KC19_6G052100 [Ceratodon purpureus]KAG0568925.1 hypothetical protein KC19_6G052100 [Ceratodon purpureus]
MNAMAGASTISAGVYTAPSTRNLSSASLSSANALRPSVPVSTRKFAPSIRCIAEPPEKIAHNISISTDGGSTKLQAEDIIGAESKLFVQTYARSPVVFVRGEGCKLYDTENKEYLDLTAGIAVNALGHGDPTWVKAVIEQAGTLAHVSNLYHTVPQVKLAERLVGSSFADRVFMVNSGTEANEAAIKFARKYHYALSKKNGGDATGATELVAFTNGFHGRTLGALSLTSKVQYRTPFEPLVPGAHFVDFGDLEATREVVVAGRTAAIFVEPLQGEGGVCSATNDFLKGLRELCDETGTLLVFDEVQCGLGRTGRLWGHEAYDVKPDIMTLAKPLAGGLPIGAVLVTERVASSIAAGDHGSTFAGGPLVCHAALAVLDRIQAPGFLESVAEKGAYLKSQLQEKLGKNPHVKEVRGEGLLVGIQLDVPASPLVAAALKAGLLILTAGKGDVVRLAPPLIISKQEIDQAVEIIQSCMPSLQ